MGDRACGGRVHSLALALVLLVTGGAVFWTGTGWASDCLNCLNRVCGGPGGSGGLGLWPACARVTRTDWLVLLHRLCGGADWSVWGACVWGGCRPDLSDTPGLLCKCSAPLIGVGQSGPLALPGGVRHLSFSLIHI